MTIVKPKLRGLKEEDFYDFDASLDYRVSTRTSRVIWQDHVPFHKQTRDSKMDNRTMTLATKHDDLSSIPRSYMDGGEKQLLTVVL